MENSMKIKVWLNSGANIHSTKTTIIDLEKDLGIFDNEWRDMPEKEQEEIMREIAFEGSDWGYKEL
jgi:hypothetical protein